VENFIILIGNFISFYSVCWFYFCRRTSCDSIYELSFKQRPLENFAEGDSVSILRLVKEPVNGRVIGKRPDGTIEVEYNVEVGGGEKTIKAGFPASWLMKLSDAPGGC